jgi:hypothetical protein
MDTTNTNEQLPEGLEKALAPDTKTEILPSIQETAWWNASNEALVPERVKPKTRFWHCRQAGTLAARAKMGVQNQWEVGVALLAEGDQFSRGKGRLIAEGRAFRQRAGSLSCLMSTTQLEILVRALKFLESRVGKSDFLVETMRAAMRQNEDLMKLNLILGAFTFPTTEISFVRSSDINALPTGRLVTEPTFAELFAAAERNARAGREKQRIEDYRLPPLSAIEESNDVYRQEAARMFDKPVDQVTKAERAQAKTKLFGQTYGTPGGESLTIDDLWMSKHDFLEREVQNDEQILDTGAETCDMDTDCVCGTNDPECPTFQKKESNDMQYAQIHGNLVIQKGDILKVKGEEKPIPPEFLDAGIQVQMLTTIVARRDECFEDEIQVLRERDPNGLPLTLAELEETFELLDDEDELQHGDVIRIGDAYWAVPSAFISSFDTVDDLRDAVRDARSYSEYDKTRIYRATLPPMAEKEQLEKRFLGQPQLFSENGGKWSDWAGCHEIIDH